jgi:hypothetical protein
MATFIECKNHAILAVGGYPSLAPSQTREQRLTEIINQAGEHLFAREWRFRERTTKFINLVADQAYVSLPTDCEGILSILSTFSLGYLIEMITPDHMEQLRQLGLTMTGPMVKHATFTRAPESAGAVINEPRLDIYPTPSGAQTNAIAVRYRSKWVQLSSTAADAYEIPIPKYVDALYIAYVRAFAQAYEDEGLSARIQEIDAGPLLATALTKDGLMQRDIGRLRPSRSGDSQNWTRPDYGYVSNPS